MVWHNRAGLTQPTDDAAGGSPAAWPVAVIEHLDALDLTDPTLLGEPQDE